MARRRKGRPISGWLVLDKPVGVGSTEAVGKVRWLFGAQKAGHAGTLDPLASGMLPLALGDATRTVPHVMDGEKRYRFEVSWGEERATDDREGEVTERSEDRPAMDAIEAVLPGYIGEIQQTPPAFSAVKIDGARAYDLARGGEQPVIEPRMVTIHDLRLIDADRDAARFETRCGKGTYVRALARDMGRALGCLGHVSALRRLEVAPFDEGDMIGWDEVLATETLEPEERHAALDAMLLDPVEALEGQPRVELSGDQATRVLNGNPVILRGRDAPLPAEHAHAVHRGRLVALGRIGEGAFQPSRVFPAR